MQSIIISVQIQYIDFKTIGFQRRTFTDNLYTIEALTEEQFINYLYSCKIEEADDIKTKIKKLMHDLDKDWLKERKKSSKSKKKNIEIESENIEDDPNKNKNISENIENESDEEDIDIDNEDETETENIENEYSELDEINCIGSEDELQFVEPPETQTCDEGVIILNKEYQKKIEQLQKIDSDYDFDHLIPKEKKTIEQLESEYEYKFQFKELDHFDHKNWLLWKFFDTNGKLIRRFASRKTAEKVRNCTAKSMAKNSLQTEVWHFDNQKMLDLEEKTLQEIKEGANKKIIYTSEEDAIKTLRRKLVLSKFQPSAEEKKSMDVEEEKDEEEEEETEEEEERGKKTDKPRRGRPPKEKVTIKFDNTFAHLVTSDGGMSLYVTYFFHIFSFQILYFSQFFMFIFYIL